VTINPVKGDQGESCTASKDAETGVVTIKCGDDEQTINPVKGDQGESCTASKDAETGVVTIKCGDDEQTINPVKGDKGNSCETVQGVGYVDIICKDAEGNVTSSSKLIAAGYKACGDEIINTTTHFCYVEGETKTVYAKCNGSEFDPTTKECSCIVPGDMSTCSVVDKSASYDILCGIELISTITHFCYNDTPYKKCNGNEYNPGTHDCLCTDSKDDSTCNTSLRQ